jgi:hypothetical protein
VPEGWPVGKVTGDVARRRSEMGSMEEVRGERAEAESKVDEDQPEKDEDRNHAFARPITDGSDERVAQ